MMLHSIATVSLSGPFDAKIAAIAAAGFAGVEIFENDLLTSPLSPADVGRMIRDAGLVCTAFQPFRDFEGMPDDLRGRTFDRLERKFDLMEKLGARLLLICSSVSPASLPDRNRIIADFREAGERAQARGLTVGYEALAWGRHVNDHRDAWSIVRDAAHPGTGLILDSFHSLARNVPIASIGDIDPQKIVLVQVADAPRLQMDELSWSRHFRNMPGQGDLPLADYVEALVKIGYDGPISLEIFNDRFRAGSAQQVAIDGRRSLIYLDDRIARRRGGEALPPRVTCTGIEFIEFAASEAEAPQLQAMLAALGFAETGRHRRKAVSRWTQGDINLVVNCEKEGFAHSFDLVHGASACAIGLRVPDAMAAMARAEALRMERFIQPVAEGEYDIPCVRGVGGSLLYFVAEDQNDAIWTTEFAPVDNDGVAGAGLARIDHIAQSMGYEEMLSWLLFYTSLLDVAKTPQLEIADPQGLVQSQAIEGHGLRITMNGSAAHQTLPSRFLHHYMGAGVQHIALATDDIFAAVESVRAAGAEPLPIPPNYYDDLEARFGLEPELIDRMARLDILYDRDEDGEYFQFYTRAFARRFFFELVERRGYGAYGATNAAVRLASQARYRDPAEAL